MRQTFEELSEKLGISIRLATEEDLDRLGRYAIGPKRQKPKDKTKEVDISKEDHVD